MTEQQGVHDIIAAQREQIAGLLLIIGAHTPIAAFDLATTWQAEKALMQDEIAALKMQLEVNAGGPTDGPWWVERPENADAYIAYGIRGDLSETYDLMEAYNVDTDYELMARAPVLKAALARYTNADDCEYGNGPPCPGDVGVPQCMYCQARAALDAREG